MEIPQRKRIRIENYDYSQNGLYFITICTKDRIPYFCEITGIPETVGADIIRPCIRLTETGNILKASISQIEEHYEDIKVLKYCIMPEHVHIVLLIDHDILSADGGRIISAPTISTVIGSMKRYVSKKTSSRIWQRSFYDHIVRNEDELRRIYEYIDNNPVYRVNNIYDQNFWR